MSAKKPEPEVPHHLPKPPKASKRRLTDVEKERFWQKHQRRFREFLAAHDIPSDGAAGVPARRVVHRRLFD